MEKQEGKKPCGGCGDPRKNLQLMGQETEEIQRLLIEAYQKAQNLLMRVKCPRCVNRMMFMVEGLEILSKMNLFAEAYRETADAWRAWIRRVAKEEGLQEENNQP